MLRCRIISVKKTIIKLTLCETDCNSWCTTYFNSVPIEAFREIKQLVLVAHALQESLINSQLYQIVLEFNHHQS